MPSIAMPNADPTSAHLTERERALMDQYGRQCVKEYDGLAAKIESASNTIEKLSGEFDELYYKTLAQDTSSAGRVVSFLQRVRFLGANDGSCHPDATPAMKQLADTLLAEERHLGELESRKAFLELPVRIARLSEKIDRAPLQTSSKKDERSNLIALLAQAHVLKLGTDTLACDVASAAINLAPAAAWTGKQFIECVTSPAVQGSTSSTQPQAQWSDPLAFPEAMSAAISTASPAPWKLTPPPGEARHTETNPDSNDSAVSVEKKRAINAYLDKLVAGNFVFGHEHVLLGLISQLDDFPRNMFISICDAHGNEERKIHRGKLEPYSFPTRLIRHPDGRYAFWDGRRDAKGHPLKPKTLNTDQLLQRILLRTWPDIRRARIDNDHASARQKIQDVRARLADLANVQRMTLFADLQKPDSYLNVIRAGDFGDIAEGLKNYSPPRLLKNAEREDVRWNGVGHVRNSKSCTGTLLDTRTATSASDTPAYVLTNGHCISKDFGKILVDSPLPGGSVEFGIFHDTANRLTVPVKKVVYSSMTGHDVALLELAEPLSSLVGKGIRPIRIAQQTPAHGSDILQITAPVFGPAPIGVLKVSACTQYSVDGTVKADQSGAWLWHNMVGNRCSGLYEGGSGGPILDRKSNEVYAVVNSGTILNPDTFENNGSRVSFLKQCFVEGVISHDPEVCSLFPAYSVNVGPAYNAPARYAKMTTDADGQPVIPDWNFSFGINAPYYRYKDVLTTSSCSDETAEGNYSPPIPSSNTTISHSMRAEPGVQYLCIMGVTSPMGKPLEGELLNAFAIDRELLTASTVLAPKLSVQPDRIFKGGQIVRVQADNREYSSYTAKAGDAKIINCDDPAGYRRYHFRPFTVSLAMLPYTVCIKGIDHAGQVSAANQLTISEDEKNTGAVISPDPLSAFYKSH